MVEQFYHQDPYSSYGSYNNYGRSSSRYGQNPYYSRDYLYYECRQNARSRQDFKDCDYYRDEYDYDYFNEPCDDDYDYEDDYDDDDDWYDDDC